MPLTLAQFFDRSEWSLRAAVVVDPFREARADPGHLFELGAVGAVQIGEGRRDWLASASRRVRFHNLETPVSPKSKTMKTLERKLPAALSDDWGRGRVASWWRVRPSRQPCREYGIRDNLTGPFGRSKSVGLRSLLLLRFRFLDDQAGAGVQALHAGYRRPPSTRRPRRRSSRRRRASPSGLNATAYT